MARELDLIEQLKNLSLVCEMTSSSLKLDMLKLTSYIFEEIREGLRVDLRLVDRVVLINQGKKWNTEWMRT
jgi:hypothetical protein